MALHGPEPRMLQRQKTLDISERDRLMRRLSSLDNEWQSWEAHLKEVSDFLMPRSGRFFVQDRNKGDKRFNNILDNTGIRAMRVLGAGMASGASSAARPWFRLATADPAMMDSEAVQQWLYEARRRMLHVFHKSNTYRSLHTKYEEGGVFGTSASILMDDYDTVIHDYGLTIGEYRLGTDYRGDVNTLARRFEKTVGEMVGEFGYNNCSTTVKSMYDRGEYDNWVPVIHMIQPREFFDATKRDSENMPFQSVYFEEGMGIDTVLRNSGMKNFRALTPRWRLTPGNVYGEGQGMEALGDVKQLQHEQLRKAQGIDYQTNPPIQVPVGMKNREVDRLPGGVTYYDAVAGTNAPIRNAFEVPLRLDFLLQDINDVRQRINQSFFVDMFLMIANNQSGPQQTATEVAEKHEEKMLMLGPVLENLHHEELQPRVTMTFERMLEAGLLPPPPPELEGQELNIEFVSVLAQAQRAISTANVDRFVVGLGQLAAIKPNVIDRLDEDEWVDAYSDMLGVDPKLIVPTKEAAFIRSERAKVAQQQQQAAAVQQVADSAHKLGSVKTDERNAASDVMRNLQGYS